MARQSEKIDPVVETEIRAEIDSLAERYTKRADLTREAATLLFLRYGIYPSATVVHSYTRLGSLTDINSDLKNFWQSLRDRCAVQITGTQLPQVVLEKVGEALTDIWALAVTEAQSSFDQLREESAATVTQVRRELQSARDEVERIEIDASKRIEQANKERERAEERRADAEQQLAVERQSREDALLKIADAETRAQQERIARENSEQRFTAELEALRSSMADQNKRLVGEVNFAKMQIDQARDEGRNLKLINDQLKSDKDTIEKTSRAKINSLLEDIGKLRSSLDASEIRISMYAPQVANLNQMLTSANNRAENAESALRDSQASLTSAQELISSIGIKPITSQRKAPLRSARKNFTQRKL